jgi:hypothetical protein
MNKIILFLLFFLPASFFSQPATTLDKKSRTAIVNKVSQLLLDNYVYPDTALRMSSYIKKRLKEGAYDTIKDRIAFSGIVTNDLYAVYHDGHLQLQYNPAMETQLLDPPANNASGTEDPMERNRRANFGLKKVEIINGNIGYLKMDNFWADDKYGRETVKAALKFVENTNGLIIDLRTNGGGSPQTVAMICGFFMKQRTHINDSYNRAANATTEYWGEPDNTLKKMQDIPLYVLTSNKTFSAAEEFAYDLQNLKRATIVGEVTGGGAHNTFEQPAGNGFVLYIPYGRAVNPITKTNWEKAGVQPDFVTTADKALETAEMEIFREQMKNTTNERELFDLDWQLDLLKAANNPVSIDAETLKKFAGVYDDRTFTFENGKLFYQRTGKPKFEMEPITFTRMKAKGNDYFKIEFIANAQGNVEEVKAYYQDHRVETSKRTK